MNTLTTGRTENRILRTWVQGMAELVGTKEAMPDELIGRS